ncbi:MAG: NAD(P)H-dependent flavin oxidoreductase [Alphaproteobacteria bacterium]
MALRTKLTDLLGIRHPIIQAPMGGTAGGVLAAAVSAAGGLGMIGAGQGRVDWLEPQLAAAGNQRVGCGFITWGLTHRPEALDLVLAHSPSAIMLSFGNAAPFIPRIKESGTPVICQVQTVAMAREVLQLGTDIIVAQGAEAGGHGLQRATLPLVPAVVDAVKEAGKDVPVVAAGGIADGRGLAAMLMLGASGVLIGTLFHSAEESLASAETKARIVRSSGDETVRTRVFDIGREAPWPGGFTGRGLTNRFVETWHGREEILTADAAEKARYQRALTADDLDTAVVWAGEGIDLIHEVEPAGLIVTRLVAEAEEALAQRFA